MDAKNKPKPTSFEYGLSCQTELEEKYRNRENNHWKDRIKLANLLISNHVTDKLSRKNKNEINIIDIGCSIGTFAIEFAKVGYNTYGIDFDSCAIERAIKLSKEEKVSPIFITGDVSDLNVDIPLIDIAICFDIFEHLHDDELGSLLVSIKKRLAKDGCLVFHTFPTEYERIFYINNFMCFPLIPFRWLSDNIFKRIVRAYGLMIDVVLVLLIGKTFKDIIKTESHCNPLSKERIIDIFQRTGYEVIFIETTNLYKFNLFVQKMFAKKTVSHRNLYGVVRKKENSDIIT